MTKQANNQTGKFHPPYFAEFISTPASIELREFYFKTRKTHPIRKRSKPYSGSSTPQTTVLEVIE